MADFSEAEVSYVHTCMQVCISFVVFMKTSIAVDHYVPGICVLLIKS
jgi:hypothetical protein